MTKKHEDVEKRENNQLSRRDALKGIAALGGSAALLTIPKKWETPVLRVGILPAYAQLSPLVACGAAIANLTITGAQGSCNPIIGQSGTLFTINLDYSAQGNSCGPLVINETIVRASFTFLPSNTQDSDDTLLSAVNVSNNGSKVAVPVCVSFGSDTNVNIEVALITQNQFITNALTVNASNPGAYPAQGQGVLPTAKLNP